MTNYREILRLNSLGYNNSEIADACDCSRTTVIATLRQADAVGIRYPLPDSMSDKDLLQALFPSAPAKAVYQMPDYEKAHRDYQAKRVTLNQLWIEYCEACQKSGVLPYQLTQFKKYYREYAVKNSATMHLNHKPGEVLQVDWAGDTASMYGSPGPPLKFSLTVFVSAHTRACTAEPINTAPWKNICRKSISSISSGTETGSVNGRRRSEAVPVPRLTRCFQGIR